MRWNCFLTCLLLYIFGWCHAALAAEAVSLRSSKKDDYTRIVLEWPSAAAHTLDRSAKDNLVVTFSKAGSLATTGIIDNPAVSGVKVLNNNPLTLSFSVNPTSRIRDLKAGNRLIVDVYDPRADEQDTAKKAPPAPSEAFKAPLLKPEEKNAPKNAKNIGDANQKNKAEIIKTAAKVENLNEVKDEAKPLQSVTPHENEIKPELAKTELTKPEIKITEKTETKIETKTEAKTEAKTEEKKSTTDFPSIAPDTALAPELKEPARKGETKIVYTSTELFGMAAFVRQGQMFFVSDKDDLLIEPLVRGVLQGALGAPQKAQITEGKADIFPHPRGAFLSGQGGDLVWRVSVTSEPVKRKIVDVGRVDAVNQSPRSGKIIWRLGSARKVLDVKDPQSGQTIKVITVSKANVSTGAALHFVDFDVMESGFGMAIVPKVDDLEIKVVEGDVEISRPLGLAQTDLQVFETAGKVIPRWVRDAQSRIYDFAGWQLGGIRMLAENRTAILSAYHDLEEGERAESLVTLAKMYVANGMGSECLGILDMAAHELPALLDSPEFLAIRGAAMLINGAEEDALVEFSKESLKPFPEILYWKAAALAGLGDWQQAAEIMPDTVGAVQDYPLELKARLGLILSEIALRAGEVKLATEFMKPLKVYKRFLRDPHVAALEYLMGEAARQDKKNDMTAKLWDPLMHGTDDLYRVKAGLALTRLKVNNKQLTPGRAIDSLEQLRYAWRGDELEANVNSWLGRTYFEAGQYVKGMLLIRDAASYVKGTEQEQKITADMQDMFIDLFLGDKLKKVAAQDAVALYNQFTNLVPSDERGEKIAEVLAEHLVKAELLSRAGDLLNTQLQTRLQGEKAYHTAERLAAIRLLDGKPDQAIAALNHAQQKFSELPAEMKTQVRARKLDLLRARALSKQGHPDQAIQILRGMENAPEANALKADIAWQAAYWDDAAEALGDVILDKNISLTRPLDPKNTSLLLQRAIALNLASNRIGLANMREKYSDLMNQTDKAKIFEVITRPRQSGALADRDTLLGAVTEVDLFSDFLNSYKSMKEPLSN